MRKQDYILYAILITLVLLMPHRLWAQTEEQADSIAREQELNRVLVKAAQDTRSRSRVENVDLIGKSQLTRAACCNLGESFTTNPSVDVSYSDAATGARQIRLLGLSGTYVQMLTENVPNLRGASLPYSLGYVPGPWMQSIQVSKGASSVKNGYESITGQLNGGGELYDRSKYPAYFQLQAQITREFRHFSIYLGGENLTNYKIKDPIINAHHPWSPDFDATQVWGPVTGAMAYIGVRINFERI